MIHPLVKYLSVMLLLLLGSSLATAQSLTDRQVRNFIATMEELKTLESELDAFEAETGIDDQEWRSMTNVIEAMRGHQIYGKVDRAIRKHGFKDSGEWAQVADKVIAAMITLEIANQRPQYQAEMEATLAELEASDFMTAEQKAQMRAMMEQSMSTIAAMQNAPEADQRVVRPHLQKLKDIMNFDGDDEDDRY